jgi:hypothetical protein
VSASATAGGTAAQRDAAIARTLGWIALLLVGAWVAVGVLDGTVRLVDTLRIRAADDADAGWVAVTSLGADLLLSMLWFAAVGALALGVAVGAAALVLRGLRGRGAVLVLLLAASCVAQVLSINLSAAAGWSFADTTAVDADLVAAVGTVVVPLAALVVTWAVLDPVLRTPRSTRERAAAG